MVRKMKTGINRPLLVLPMKINFPTYFLGIELFSNSKPKVKYLPNFENIIKIFEMQKNNFFNKFYF